MVHNYSTNMQQFGNLLYLILFFLGTVQRGNDTAFKQAVAKYIAKVRFYTKHLA